MIYVPGCGNPNAKLMIVGEAPGKSEEEQLTPFVGASGKIVDDCLYRAGVQRSEVYATNVVKIRPPNNEIHRLPELGTKIDDFIPQLWKEVEDINPNCILAFGNVALKALTGQVGIQKYRGSILPNTHSGIPKVVATIHPASLFHDQDGKMSSPIDKTFIQFDVKRAVQQSLFREYRPPQRTLTIIKNSSELMRFWDRNTNLGHRKVAIDIETFKAIPMCIGFAFSRYEAVSVPLFDLMSDLNPEGIALHDMVFIWQLVADWLLDPQYKIIGQNYKFDQGRLEEINLDSADPYFDTAMGWHTLYSELPKKLPFISSIVTEEPYYKDDLEEYNPKKEKLKKRLIYNARDCAVEFECYEEIEKQLIEINMLDWFHEYMMPLHRFYYNIEKRGILIDKQQRTRLIKKYSRYTKWIDNALKQDLGYELNVNSPKQVTATLYGNLKCPIRKDVQEKTLEMLMLNAIKDERRKRIIRNILKGRKSRKTESTYVRAKFWPDSRMRTVYNVCGTESGRTSTNKPKPPVTREPMGVAFQTMTKHGEVGADLRVMYVPSPGKVFIEIDGKQAEDWVVTHLANDEEGKAQLSRTKFIKNKHGIKDDRHTLTAMMISGLGFDAITDEIRQDYGKKPRHAGNYKMGKRMLSLLAQISEWRAAQCLQIFHAANPHIEHVFWEEIIQALRDNDQILYSPHGRRRQFFERWGEDLFKEAFSYIPQATVSDHTKFAAMRTEARAPWIEILMESHDSFLAEIPKDRIDEAVKIMTEEYEVPIDFSKCSLPRGPLIIPSEIQIGECNWKDMRKI
jgi:uracil-DNA glycosylase